MKKKVTKKIFCISMVVAIIVCFQLNVFATTRQEREPNNSIDTATWTNVGDSMIGFIDVNTPSETDFFKFDARRTGNHTIELDLPSSLKYELKVYDENRSLIGTSTNAFIRLRLVKGLRYYIEVYSTNNTGSDYYPYALTIN